VKVAGLLEVPPTVTRTGPVAAPVGTVVVMLEAFQLVIAAPIPLKVTVPVVVPKLAPLIVTGAPTGPDAGLRFVMVGVVEVTVKLVALLGTPSTVTTTPPVVAPFGTFTTILVGLQVVAVGAVMPVNFTVLEPWPEPKLVPEMVTEVPTGPLLGLKLVIVGPENAVKGTPLLFIPLAFTTTFPEVAP
jgi:hypothetical protein